MKASAAAVRCRSRRTPRKPLWPTAPNVHTVLTVQTHGCGRCPLASRARRLVPRDGTADQAGHLRTRGHGGRRSLLHPLHLGFNRKTQRRVQHGTAGYLLHAAMTHKYVFDYHDGDIYWCTADVGWITGHSYIVYGPLANGATTLMFEGVPNWPDAARCWEVVDKHQVNIFYTAPDRHPPADGSGGRICQPHESRRLAPTPR